MESTFSQIKSLIQNDLSIEIEKISDIDFLTKVNIDNHVVVIKLQQKRDGQGYKTIRSYRASFNTDIELNVKCAAEDLFNIAYNELDKCDALYAHYSSTDLDFMSNTENFKGNGFYTTTQQHDANHLVLLTDTKELYYFNEDVYTYRIIADILNLV